MKIIADNANGKANKGSEGMERVILGFYRNRVTHHEKASFLYLINVWENNHHHHRRVEHL